SRTDWEDRPGWRVTTPKLRIRRVRVTARTRDDRIRISLYFGAPARIAGLRWDSRTSNRAGSAACDRDKEVTRTGIARRVGRRTVNSRRAYSEARARRRETD